MTRSGTIKNFSPTGGLGEELGLDNDPMYYLSRLFVYFLQNLFRDFPEGCGMKWIPDEEATEMLITAEKPSLEAIEKRPHITCVLGTTKFSGLGLDQLQNSRSSDGQRVHTDLVPSMMTYHCQAKEGLHARRIAWNATLATMQLRRLLMRAGGLHHVGTNPDISAESPVGMFKGPKVENHLVEVRSNIPFYWQPQWRITRPAELWRRLKLTMNVNNVDQIYSAGRSNKLRPPMVKGVPVSTTPIHAPPGTAFTQTVLEENFFGEEE